MFVPAGGYLLNTVDIGSGPRTLVAVGGWVGGWELWQLPLEMLHHGWRCIAYDHRGAGVSTAPPEAVTADALVDDLFAVMDHCGVERCVAAGESLGSLTVLAAYARQPERFEGLVLVDGLSASTGVPDAASVRRDFTAYVHGFVDACVPEPGHEHTRKWGRQILSRAHPEAAARMFEVHAGLDLTDVLGRIEVPVLVIHGERDAIVPVAQGRALASGIPDATLVVLPGAGHVPTMTRPDAVVDAIEAWAVRLPRAGVTDGR